MNCPSDVGFKRNIEPLGLMLGKLMCLRPVRYNWRSDEFADRHFSSQRDSGLIAQEVEQVLPELVRHDSDGHLGVAYEKLPVYTVKALQELKAENDDLRAEVGELLMSLQRQLGPQVSKAVGSRQ